MSRWQSRRERFRSLLSGNTCVSAAVRAVHDTLRALREGIAPEKIETASDEMMKRFTRNDDYARWMKDWL